MGGLVRWEFLLQTYYAMLSIQTPTVLSLPRNHEFHVELGAPLTLVLPGWVKTTHFKTNSKHLCFGGHIWCEDKFEVMCETPISASTQKEHQRCHIKDKYSAANEESYDFWSEGVTFSFWNKISFFQESLSTKELCDLIVKTGVS